MKKLLIALLSLSTLTAYASSKEILNCDSKYEKFSISVDSDNMLKMELNTWERHLGFFTSRKVEADVRNFKKKSSGLSFVTSVSNTSKVSINLELGPDNDKEVVEVKFNSDNKDVLKTLVKSLAIDEDGLKFFKDECTLKVIK